jgi:hypothetical protein
LASSAVSGTAGFPRIRPIEEEAQEHRPAKGMTGGRSTYPISARPRASHMRLLQFLPGTVPRHIALRRRTRKSPDVDHDCVRSSEGGLRLSIHPGVPDVSTQFFLLSQSFPPGGSQPVLRSSTVRYQVDVLQTPFGFEHPDRLEVEQDPERETAVWVGTRRWDRRT